MFNTFTDRLRSLAETNFSQFRKEVKSRLNGRFNEDQLATLKEFIFLMPATLRQFGIYWNREDTPPEAKRVSGYIMTYINQANDLLPIDKLGLFGYLDDAYFVVESYLQVQDQFLRDWHDKSPEELDLADRARELVTAPRLLIPEETDRIDHMVHSLIKGDTREFEEFIAQAGM